MLFDSTSGYSLCLFSFFCNDLWAGMVHHGWTRHAEYPDTPPAILTTKEHLNPSFLRLSLVVLITCIVHLLLHIPLSHRWCFLLHI